jgi:hypothetical protein
VPRPRHIWHAPSTFNASGFSVTIPKLSRELSRASGHLETRGPFLELLTPSQESAHLAQHIGFIRKEYVMVGSREPHDMRGGSAIFNSLRLAFDEGSHHCELSLLCWIGVVIRPSPRVLRARNDKRRNRNLSELLA